MQEKTLLRIAVSVTFLGLIVLYLLSGSVSIDEGVLSVADGSDVKLRGRVTDVYRGTEVSILTVSKPTLTKVVMIHENTSIEVGDEIEVIGQLDEYKGEKEIIGRRVRLIG